MTQQVIIKLFLASSIEDMKIDRLEVTSFIQELNNRYRNRGIYIEPFTCEYADISVSNQRKQEDYNDHIRNSQIFIVMFFNKAGEYTIEEFNVALQKFRESGNPCIMTFFRKGDGYNPQQSVIDFMSKLDHEIGHYFQYYTSIDTLKLYLLMHLHAMDIDAAIEFKDGYSYIGQEKILELSNLPALQNNTDYRLLSAECLAAEQDYLEAKRDYLLNTDDIETEMQFMSASNIWRDKLSKLRELEKSIVILVTKSIDGSIKGDLSARQREAYHLLEQGKYQEANSILDINDIEADYEHDLELLQYQKEKQTVRIMEILQKIGILSTLLNDSSRFEQIESLYKKAVSWEEECDLPRIATHEYIVYLEKQQDYCAAIQLEQRYLYHKASLTETTCAFVDIGHLASMYQALGDYKSAEKYFKEAIKNIPKHIDNTEIQGRAAYVYNLFGLFLVDKHSYSEAREYYKRALNLFQKLAETEPERYFPNYCDVCTNLGNLLKYQGKLLQAEKYQRESLGIYRELGKINNSAFLYDIACGCMNLGNLLLEKIIASETSEIQDHLNNTFAIYRGNTFGSLFELRTAFENRDMSRYEEPIGLLSESLEMFKGLATENPQAYMSYLADSYNNYANILSRRSVDNDKDEAEIYLRESLRIYQILSRTNEESFTPKLAFESVALATALHNNSKIDEARPLYIQALNLYQMLFDNDPDVYRELLAKTYHEYANFLAFVHRQKGEDLTEVTSCFSAAHQFYLELLQTTNSSRFDEAVCICSLQNWAIFDSHKHYNKAEEWGLIHIRDRERQTTHNKSKAFELAQAYHDMGAKYFIRCEYEKARQYYTKSFDVYNSLKQKGSNPFKAQADDSKSCIDCSEACKKLVGSFRRTWESLDKDLFTFFNPNSSYSSALEVITNIDHCLRSYMKTSSTSTEGSKTNTNTETIASAHLAYRDGDPTKCFKVFESFFRNSKTINPEIGWEYNLLLYLTGFVSHAVSFAKLYLQEVPTSSWHKVIEDIAKSFEPKITEDNFGVCVYRITGMRQTEKKAIFSSPAPMYPSSPAEILNRDSSGDTLKQMKLHFAQTFEELKRLNLPLVNNNSDVTNDFKQAVYLKRCGKFLESSILYAKIVLEKRFFSATLVKGWFKTIAASGDTADAISLAEYFLSRNPSPSYDAHEVQLHLRDLRHYINKGDYNSLAKYLEMISGNPSNKITSKESIDVFRK